MGCILTKRLSKKKVPTTRLTLLKPVKRELIHVGKTPEEVQTDFAAIGQQEHPVRRMRSPPPAPSLSPVLKRSNDKRTDTANVLTTNQNIHLAEDLEFATVNHVQTFSVESTKDNPATSGGSRSHDTHACHVNQETTNQSDGQYLSIEDLDTEVDSYRRFRAERFPIQMGDRINPTTTDILLPRRKSHSDDFTKTTTEAPSSGGTIIIENAQLTGLITSGSPRSPRNDGPRNFESQTNNNENPHEDKTRETIVSSHKLRKTKHLNDVLDGVKFDENLTETIVDIGKAGDNYVGNTQTGTDIKQSENDVKQTGNDIIQSTNDVRHIDSSNEENGNMTAQSIRTGTPAPQSSGKSINIYIPSQIQVTEHGRERMRRKRKRVRNKKASSTSQLGSDESLHRVLETPASDKGAAVINKTTLRNRPVSGESTLTIDSFGSEGSSLPVSRSNTFITESAFPVPVVQTKN